MTKGETQGMESRWTLADLVGRHRDKERERRNRSNISSEVYEYRV